MRYKLLSITIFLLVLLMTCKKSEPLGSVEEYFYPPERCIYIYNNFSDGRSIGKIVIEINKIEKGKNEIVYFVSKCFHYGKEIPLPYKLKKKWCIYYKDFVNKKEDIIYEFKTNSDWSKEEKKGWAFLVGPVINGRAYLTEGNIKNLSSGESKKVKYKVTINKTENIIFKGKEIPCVTLNMEAFNKVKLNTNFQLILCKKLGIYGYKAMGKWLMRLNDMRCK